MLISAVIIVARSCLHLMNWQNLCIFFFFFFLKALTEIAGLPAKKRGGATTERANYQHGAPKVWRRLITEREKQTTWRPVPPAPTWAFCPVVAIIAVSFHTVAPVTAVGVAAGPHRSAQLLSAAFGNCAFIYVCTERRDGRRVLSVIPQFYFFFIPTRVLDLKKKKLSKENVHLTWSPYSKKVVSSVPTRHQPGPNSYLCSFSGHPRCEWIHRSRCSCSSRAGWNIFRLCIC